MRHCMSPLDFTVEELDHWISKGVDFISASTDMWSILKKGMELLERMKAISEEYPVYADAKI